MCTDKVRAWRCLQVKNRGSDFEAQELRERLLRLLHETENHRVTRVLMAQWTHPDHQCFRVFITFARAKRAAHCAEAVGAGIWEPVMQGTGTSDFFKTCRQEWQRAGFNILVDHDEVRRDGGNAKALPPSLASPGGGLARQSPTVPAPGHPFADPPPRLLPHWRSFDGTPNSRNAAGPASFGEGADALLEAIAIQSSSPADTAVAVGAHTHPNSNRVESGDHGLPVVDTARLVTEARGLRLHLSSNSSTGYLGVSNSGDKFLAKRVVNGTHVSLGLFDSNVEAAMAYAASLRLEAAGLVEAHVEGAPLAERVASEPDAMGGLGRTGEAALSLLEAAAGGGALGEIPVALAEARPEGHAAHDAMGGAMYDLLNPPRAPAAKASLTWKKPVAWEPPQGAPAAEAALGEGSAAEGVDEMEAVFHLFNRGVSTAAREGEGEDAEATVLALVGAAREAAEMGGAEVAAAAEAAAAVAGEEEAKAWEARREEAGAAQGAPPVPADAVPHVARAERTEGANASAGSGTFKVGQLVKIKDVTVGAAQLHHFLSHPHVGWCSPMTPFLGTIGEVKSVAHDYCTVYTPDRSDAWTWPFSILEHVKGGGAVGLSVLLEGADGGLLEVSVNGDEAVGDDMVGALVADDASESLAEISRAEIAVAAGSLVHTAGRGGVGTPTDGGGGSPQHALPQQLLGKQPWLPPWSWQHGARLAAGTPCREDKVRTWRCNDVKANTDLGERLRLLLLCETNNHRATRVLMAEDASGRQRVVLTFSTAKRAAHLGWVGSGIWEPVTRGTGTSDFFKETSQEWQQEGCAIHLDHDDVRPGKKRKPPTESHLHKWQMPHKLPRAPPQKRLTAPNPNTPSTHYVNAEVIGIGHPASASAAADGAPGHSNLAALLEVVNRTDKPPAP